MRRLTATHPVRLHLPEFRRVQVIQVGCGGTGSHLASALIAIALALDAQGVGMDLLLVDPDTVEPKNVGRQLFALADVGRPKAQVLAERLNAAFGTKAGAGVWALDREHDLASTLELTAEVREPTLRLVVGCVDNPAARRLIAARVREAYGRVWWLDIGNDHHSGQIALGNECDKTRLVGSVSLGLTDRLPAPLLVYPDLVDAPKREQRKRAPSCAELTATGEQSLQVNRVMAAWAAAMLTDFLVTRSLRYWALAVGLEYGGTRAYGLDVETLAEVTQLRPDQLVAKARKRRRNPYDDIEEEEG